MKRNKKLSNFSKKTFLTFLTLPLIFFASCNQLPNYPSSEEKEAGSVTYSIDGNEVEIKSVNASLSSNFIRGFDASASNDSGTGSYCNALGNEEDIFAVLSDYGINYVRLRIWNNPDSTKLPSAPGASNLSVVLNQAKRVKENNMKFLLDFHYSDYWVDPAKQLIPEDWLSCTSQSEMCEKIISYTKEVLQALVDENAEPNMIQIGNEISSGILKHKSLTFDSDGNFVSATNADSSVAGSFASENYFAYLAAGISAAREVCPNAKIMLHFTDINRNNPLNYLDKFENLDYDIIGLSWYSKENSHGTIANLGNLIKTIKSTYQKEVIVAETNVNHTMSSTASENYLDSTSAANLLDSSGNIYSGIDYDSKGIPASIQNQANILRVVIEVCAVNGGSGVFDWGGEYKGNWNSMFAGSGKPLSSLGVFNVSGN